MRLIDKESFKKSVYDVVQLIPCGRATSYGAIAKAIGFPAMSRMVGKVIGASASVPIPAHRVVNNQGRLSGKNAFGTNNEMQRLLEAEGVVVVNDKISAWKEIYWDPLEEIHIF